MKIKDIHTHVLPQEPGTALVCIGCGPMPKAQGHLFSAGLHPWDVTGHDQEAYDNLEKLLSLPNVLAVGECGFDTLRGPSHELQEQAFVCQYELSEHYCKPMILHVVRDFDTVIRLHKQLRPTMPWLIHGFRGAPQQMHQLHSQNLLLSLGPTCNPQSLHQLPLDKLFLETDGNADINEVIKIAALSKGVSFEYIEQHLSNNAVSFIFQKP
ncbi:MAG: TatD family hydrolase [Bacteroidaceae bacterium]|nr:TatD family hydrolase [Bacteroidaceae bacterium]